jgi:hypothetical protein
MEPARLGTSKRRPRRGSVESPVDTRLVRKLALVLVLPLLLAVFTMPRPGPLPAPVLPPSFDGPTATALTTEFARLDANRIPGSLEALNAAQWVRDKLALYGLPVREDAWKEDVPGIGRVELRNLASVVRGTLDETIVLVAHRDNNGLSAGANDNASGTAALVELARAYATAGTTESARTPLHTLVFLSTDGGAYGSLGAERFATRSPLAQDAVAVISLDGLAGRARTRLEVGGLDGRSPPPALVRTATERIEAETGREPERAGFLAQLVGLALPYGFGEQAPLLGEDLPAVRITTAVDGGTPPGADEVDGLDAARLDRLGRASELLLTSLDASVEIPSATSGAVFVGHRAIRGWAVELLLLAAVVPFAGATLDLLSRCRRRRLPLSSAWRALRRRFGLWLALLVLLGVAAIVGALPREPRLPPAPDQPPVDSWPVGALAVGAVAAALVWLRVRARLVPRIRATPEEDLAAYAVAFVALLLVSALTALVSPYGLLFVLPSMYAWLLLPRLRRARGWLTDVVFGLGLIGPVLPVVVIAEQLELGARAPLYAASLLTTGVVPWGSTLALAGWGAVAGFVAAIAAGRYAAPAVSSGR